jgi:glycogen(starch) synthase
VRVLHLSSEYPPQKVFGLGRFVHDLAVAQAAQGDRVTVVTNSLGGADHDIVRDGVHVCRTAFPPPPKPPLSETQVLQFNFGVVARAMEAADAGDEWDILNAHDWYLLPTADILRQRLGVPVCFTVHDTIVGKQFGELTNPTKFIANVEMWGCRTAESVVCCTEYMRHEVVERYGAPPERVAVVPCGVAQDTFGVSRLEHLQTFRDVLARPHEPIVLYVGRLDPEKGIEALLEAIPQVLASAPEAKFVLAGTGRLEGRVASFVHEHGLKDRVLALGYVGPAPLAFLYRCADVQVCPSTYEPFGIVALEGMLNGRAVVVSDSTGLAEVVEPEVDGLHCETGSAGSLAGAVLRLLRDDGLRKRLGEAAARSARESYNWPRIAELTEPAYRMAQENREAAP